MLIDRVTRVVSTGRAFRFVPCGPRRHLAIDRTLNMTPHLRQLRFRVRIAITFFCFENEGKRSKLSNLIHNGYCLHTWNRRRIHRCGERRKRSYSALLLRSWILLAADTNSTRTPANDAASGSCPYTTGLLPAAGKEPRCRSGCGWWIAPASSLLDTVLRPWGWNSEKKNRRKKKKVVEKSQWWTTFFTRNLSLGPTRRLLLYRAHEYLWIVFHESF